MADGGADVVSLLERAELLADSGELDAAAALAGRALDAAGTPVDRADALLLAAELAALGGDLGRARELVADLDLGAVDAAELLARAGSLALTFDDPRGAADLFARAAAADPRFADAHHGLGVARELMGDRAGMIAAFQRVRELDAAAEPPAWRFSDDEFVAIAEAAMSELPDPVIALLENVPILVDDAPSADIIAEGYDARLLGLFSGVPLPHKSHVTEQQPVIDAIHLYQRNLERVCQGADELADEIRTTVLHETAHFFGLEDDDLEDIGLG